jgi:aerobic-type carbon monoxide dehydrogenase small subunit (CoxS/CutS family)
MTHIVLNVDGRRRDLDVDDSTMLLDALRSSCAVTSAREGCGVGACGACTVLSDGMSVSSCLALAVRYDGADIATASGLPEDDPVVAAFVRHSALQCGYCTPGFIMMATELLSENPSPTREDVLEHLRGNICRCGAYEEIIAAVLDAAASSKQ